MKTSTDKDSAEGLLPCPFCGGTATFLETYIACDCCLADVHRRKNDTAEQLVAAWNNRAFLSQSGEGDSGCRCKGNWRLLLSEYEQFFGRKYRDSGTGNVFTFIGLVHSDDDYYYGMYRPCDLRLISCVMSLEQAGLTPLPTEK